MPSITTELQGCKNLRELSSFCSHLKVTIGKFGGRRISKDQLQGNVSGTVAMKDIAKRFNEICKEKLTDKSIPDYVKAVKGINDIDYIANRTLKKSATTIQKILTAIKSFFSGYSRSKFHKETFSREDASYRKEMNKWYGRLTSENKAIIKKYLPSILKFNTQISKEYDPRKIEKLEKELKYQANQEIPSLLLKIDSKKSLKYCTALLMQLTLRKCPVERYTNFWLSKLKDNMGA